MKTYEEMANSVLQKIEKRKKERTAMLRKVSGTAVCICVLCLLSVAVFSGALHKPAPLLSQSDIETISESDNNNQNAENPIDNQQVSGDYSNDFLFKINEIVDVADAAEKYYDPATHSFVKWTEGEMRDYLGVDMSVIPKILPSGWGFERKHNDGFEVIYDENGDLVRDKAGYFYSGKDGRSILLLASRLGRPYDCIYTFSTEYTTLLAVSESEVFELFVGGMNMRKDAMEYEKYVVDFYYDGVYYRVVSENVESYHLYAVIRFLVGDTRE